MQKIVNLAHQVLPRRIFKAIRRRYPLCDYNFHSAFRYVVPRNRRNLLATQEVCKHCGAFVYRDGFDQWRKVNNLMSLLKQMLVSEEDIRIEDEELQNSRGSALHEIEI